MLLYRLLNFSSEEYILLADQGDHAPLPDSRKHTALFVIIVTGTIVENAQLELCRPPDPDTVFGWVNRWLAKGPS